MFVRLTFLYNSEKMSLLFFVVVFKNTLEIRIKVMGVKFDLEYQLYSSMTSISCKQLNVLVWCQFISSVCVCVSEERLEPSTFPDYNNRAVTPMSLNDLHFIRLAVAYLEIIHLHL